MLHRTTLENKMIEFSDIIQKQQPNGEMDLSRLTISAHA
jgi:hypothetical protein